jgi:hypothetical protein
VLWSYIIPRVYRYGVKAPFQGIRSVTATAERERGGTRPFPVPAGWAGGRDDPAIRGGVCERWRPDYYINYGLIFKATKAERLNSSTPFVHDHDQGFPAASW